LKHVFLPNEEYKKKKNKSYFSKSNKKVENININKINNNYLSTNNIIFDTKLFIDSSNTNIFKNTVYLKLLKLSNDFTYNTDIFNRDNSYIYNNIISTFYIKNKTTEDELYNYYNNNNNYEIYNLIKSKFVNEIISFNKRKNNIINKINVFYKKDKSDNIKNNRIL